VTSGTILRSDKARNHSKVIEDLKLPSLDHSPSEGKWAHRAVEEAYDQEQEVEIDALDKVGMVVWGMRPTLNLCQVGIEQLRKPINRVDGWLDFFRLRMMIERVQGSVGLAISAYGLQEEARARHSWREREGG
jgi:hypothetical protein